MLFPVSPLLLAAIVAAIISTIAVGVCTVVAAQGHPPGPGGGPPNGQGPPPGLDQDSVVALVISTSIFVISWVMVIGAVMRDQMMRRLVTLAADQTEELAAMEQRFEALTHAYGERRESDGYTEGFLAGMRQAGGPPGSDGRAGGDGRPGNDGPSGLDGRAAGDGRPGGWRRPLRSVPRNGPPAPRASSDDQPLDPDGSDPSS